jgi:hypothetical protein
MSALEFWLGCTHARDRERHKILMPTCPFRLLGLRPLRYLIDGLAYKPSLTIPRATGLSHIITSLLTLYLTVMAQCGVVATRSALSSRHGVSRWNEQAPSIEQWWLSDPGSLDTTGHAVTDRTERSGLRIWAEVTRILSDRGPDANFLRAKGPGGGRSRGPTNATPTFLVVTKAGRRGHLCIDAGRIDDPNESAPAGKATDQPGEIPVRWSIAEPPRITGQP